MNSPAGVGARLYQIRLAKGDGVRTPMPQLAFAKLVELETGTRYDPATISLLEREQQRWKLEDVETFARVDPLMRGRVWLAFGVDHPLEGEYPPPGRAKPLPSSGFLPRSSAAIAAEKKRGGKKTS